MTRVVRIEKAPLIGLFAAASVLFCISGCSEETTDLAFLGDDAFAETLPNPAKDAYAQALDFLAPRLPLMHRASGHDIVGVSDAGAPLSGNYRLTETPIESTEALRGLLRGHLRSAQGVPPERIRRERASGEVVWRVSWTNDVGDTEYTFAQLREGSYLPTGEFVADGDRMTVELVEAPVGDSAQALIGRATAAHNLNPLR